MFCCLYIDPIFLLLNLRLLTPSIRHLSSEPAQPLISTVKTSCRRHSMLCVYVIYIRSIPSILPYLNFLHVVAFPSSLFLMVLVPRSSSAVSTLPPFPTYPSILPYGIKRTYILAIRVRIVVLLRSRQFYLQWFIVCLLERVSIKSKYP